MKRYFSIVAVIIAIAAVAFTTPSVKDGGNLTDTYFKFIGTPGVDEDDETKWEEITSTLYFDESITSPLRCPSTQRGCKLIATQTQVINLVVRPQEVPVEVVGNPSHKNPILGTYVSAFKNKQSN